MANKLLILISLLLTGTFSCEDSQLAELKATCLKDTSAGDLAWLQDKVKAITAQESSYEYIKQAEYNGQTVFICGNCNPLWNSSILVYNCQGQLICTLFSKECPNLLNEIKDVKVIAKSKNTLCNL